MSTKSGLLFIFLIILNQLYGQNKVSISEFNGIWKNIDKERVFYLIKENKALYINKRNVQDDENIFYIDRIGFCINYDTLENRCNQYLSQVFKTDHLCIEGQVYDFSHDYPIYINSRIEIIGNGVNIFEKIEKFNNKDLFDILLTSNIKIPLKEFLTKEYSLIKSQKSILHKSPHQPTKMYLIQNDPVEVVEERDDWLKIKYYPEKNGEWTGKVIEGWIKKTDVE